MPHSVRNFLPRKDFPRGFTIGAATSAFQIEGAAHEDGRGPSIWDTFCKKKGYDIGNAIDHYHQYKEDVEMMKWLGLEAYGFSISWSRILPTGRKSGGLNFEGVKFYKDLIKELLANGIKPYVTLFYWDVPQALEDKYGGFRDSQIIDDFGDYADICFMLFGNDVKHWTTINKPGIFSEGGYAFGSLAPGRGDNSDEANSVNPEGDPTRSEPYIVTHNLLLAHAKAVEVYRTRYKETQKGLIGIALQSFYFEPASKSEKDKKATERALDFSLNRFLDPITVGHYPNALEEIMKARNIDHEFSQKGSGAVMGSIDFLGLDYYTASYVCDKPDHDKDNDPTYTIDQHFEFPEKRRMEGDWPGASDTVHPQGLKHVLIYVKSKYNGPIYITENGFGEKNSKLLRHEAHHDIQRFSYMHQHLSQIMEVAKENAPNRVDVRGYFAWTLWDNFDWEKGLDVLYGIIHVDFENNLKRTPKFSAHWLKYILQKQPRKKRRQPGFIKAGTGPRGVSTRTLGPSSISTRSQQPQAMDRDVGMSASSFASEEFSTRSASSLGSNAFGRTYTSDEFSTRSASSLGSNAFGRTYTSNVSRRQLESEYEEDDDYEEEDEDYESNIEEDEESDKDSDPAHGSLDEEDEEDEDSDANSAPIRPVAPRRYQ